MLQFNFNTRATSLLVSIIVSGLCLGCIDNSSVVEEQLPSEIIFEHKCSSNVINLTANEKENQITIIINEELFEQFSDEKSYIKAISSLNDFQFPPVAYCDGAGTRLVFLPAHNAVKRKSFALYLYDDPQYNQYTVIDDFPVTYPDK